jgi:ADP-ribose pyrophosphatase YjhB (NUDIX family)
MWDMSSSGHVEHGENMTATVLRETREEIGLQLNSNDVHFVTLIHKREEERDLTYYNGYFMCENFKGEPTICEPSKCSELKWFPIDNLPDDLIADRKLALNALTKKIPYIEFGWNNK